MTRIIVWCRECGYAWEGDNRTFAVAHCHSNRQAYVTFVESERAQAESVAANGGADLARKVTIEPHNVIIVSH